jgi:HD domain
MMAMNLRPLPPEAQRLCQQLDVPPRLLAHLQLVHDVAAELVAGIRRIFPDATFDHEAVLFGAATHDLGKVLHPNELTGPGHKHEDDGPGLLRANGISERLARFAMTHARWSDDLEDMIVALADSVWKGKRSAGLENALVKSIAAGTGLPDWEVLLQLDKIIEQIAADSIERLAWQAMVTS